MELGRVQGTVVATVKSDRLKGFKLLVVELLKADMTSTGGFSVAVDTVHAGTGDVVLVVRGSSARQTSKLTTVPADASIVAMVDSVFYRGQLVYEKDRPDGQDQ